MAKGTEYKEDFTYTSAPEPGQLAEVRRRQWVVSEVQGSYDTETQRPGQNYVTLTSIDEDALGEELEVVWEIEPGAHVIEKAGLPTIDGQDDSKQLQSFLDAVRWGAASTADLKNIQSPFRSGIEIEDYQLDPVVRAIQMPRVNLLIADDVGLGKTIEAGMIIHQQLLTGRANRVLVLVPPSLLHQWLVEMLRRFNLHFSLFDMDRLAQISEGNPFEAAPP